MNDKNADNVVEIQPETALLMEEAEQLRLELAEVKLELFRKTVKEQETALVEARNAVMREIAERLEIDAKMCSFNINKGTVTLRNQETTDGNRDRNQP